MTKKQKAHIVLTQLKKLYPVPKMALNFSSHSELLFAVLMSAQTTDAQVNKVTETLFKKYPILESYITANPKQFEKDISSIGLFRNKAKNILETANILHEKYHGILPKSIEEIIQFPGCGRKTANVVLGIAYGITEGIAVDTHVMRLSKKFGLTKHTDPKKIEKELMLLLPKKEWGYFTIRMIQYGRAYSPANKKTADDPISLLLSREAC